MLSTIREKDKHASRLVLAAFVALALVGSVMDIASAQRVTDAALEERVSSAIENASDLPESLLTVAVTEGVVTLTGSVVCEDCGGTLTPGGTATVQQSLGAVVPAVTGVVRVEFELQYRPPAD